MLSDIKMKKKFVAELGHSDRLKIYINPSKIYVSPGIFSSPEPKAQGELLVCEASFVRPSSVDTFKRLLL